MKRHTTRCITAAASAASSLEERLRSARWLMNENLVFQNRHLSCTPVFFDSSSVDFNIKSKRSSPITTIQTPAPASIASNSSSESCLVSRADLVFDKPKSSRPATILHLETRARKELRFVHSAQVASRQVRAQCSRAVSLKKEREFNSLAEFSDADGSVALFKSRRRVTRAFWAGESKV